MTVRSSGRLLLFVGMVALLAGLATRSGAQPGGAGQDALTEPFKGVTTNGTVAPGLFPIKATGVSTAPVRQAAERFLATLTPEPRGRTTYPVDDLEWRKWNNVHRYARQGVSVRDMNDDQRTRAFELLRAALSAKGLEKSRHIMRLNGYIGEVLNNLKEYGDDLYYFTVMGVPSDTTPWGWQLDGHHLVVNYFILGDQVVMTPTFMGSEPVSATTGQYAGTIVLQDEQDKGLALMRSLDEAQRKKAGIETEKVRNNAQAQGFRDNLTLDYAGIKAGDLTGAQKALLIALIAEYVNNMPPSHAKIRMEEIRQHLDQTYFAWIGEVGPDTTFYYRVHSPVVLIEFDHQTPVALPGPRVPNRQHVHTVIRTPNGNDYGKDLLRQHFERHRSDRAHGHAGDWPLAGR